MLALSRVASTGLPLEDWPVKKFCMPLTCPLASLGMEGVENVSRILKHVILTPLHTPPGQSLGSPGVTVHWLPPLALTRILVSLAHLFGDSLRVQFLTLASLPVSSWAGRIPPSPHPNPEMETPDLCALI